MSNLDVLVAEDDNYERKIICEFLSKIQDIGNVDCACNGLEAIEKISSKDYDLLVLDFIMENKDGLEVLDFINRKNLKRNLKIIVVSAVGKTEIVQRAFEKGIDYYFKKSFNFSHLKNVILELFNQDYAQNSKIESSIVAKLGIPPNLLGFRFICQFLSITKSRQMSMSEAYRIIAKLNNTSYECVEINIRNAIKYAHDNKNHYYINMFGNFNNFKKPKNSVFLNTIARINDFS